MTRINHGFLVDETPVLHSMAGNAEERPAPPCTSDMSRSGEHPLTTIGRFAATIAHEARTPLATIDLALKYLDRSGQPERTARRIQLALSENRRLQRLLDDILDFARPRPLRLTRFDLRELAHEAMEGLAECEQSRKMVLHLPDAAVPISADRDRFKQVIINLLMNACQATTVGERLDIVIDQDETAGTVQMEVRNPGTIPRDLLSRLAEPFATGRASGTGLGLAIVKQIVEAHGGTLAFELPDQREVCARVSLPQHGI